MRLVLVTGLDLALLLDLFFIYYYYSGNEWKNEWSVTTFWVYVECLSVVKGKFNKGKS